MPVLRYYKTPGLTSGAQDGVIKKIQYIVGASFRSLDTELCFYIDTELGIYISHKAGLFPFQNNAEI